MRKYLQTQNKSVQMNQTASGDPWMDSEAKTLPKAIPIPPEQHLLESAPSLAHGAIAQAGAPGAKVLGVASGTARLHPVSVLLQDELKIKMAFNSSFGGHLRNAVALMIWFHSPTFG